MQEQIKKEGKSTSQSEEVLLPLSIISKNITKFRKKSGLSCKEMSEKLHITEKAYRNIEADVNKSIDIVRLLEIAKLLGVELTELLKSEADSSHISINGDNSGNNSQNSNCGNNNTNANFFSYQVNAQTFATEFISSLFTLESRISKMEQNFTSLSQQLEQLIRLNEEKQKD